MERRATSDASPSGATTLIDALDSAPFDGRPGDADNIGPDVENVVGTRFPDTLTGSEASNVLDGRSGPDTLRGLGGNDSLTEGEFATGTDDVSGGVGRDAVLYSQRRAGVTVTLHDVADDGAAGELDNVRRDVEVVAGGTGNDVMLGNAAANEFSSGGGSDRISVADEIPDDVRCGKGGGRPRTASPAGYASAAARSLDP